MKSLKLETNCMSNFIDIVARKQQSGLAAIKLEKNTLSNWTQIVSRKKK